MFSDSYTRMNICERFMHIHILVVFLDVDILQLFYSTLFIHFHAVNWFLILLSNTNNLIKAHTVKWSQVMLWITNNSIRHQSFVYSQLNNQTVLYLTIQFSISHLFALSFTAQLFYLIYRLDPIRCYYFKIEWTWEPWQWRSTPYSQSSSVGASTSHCLIYPGHSLGVGEMQPVYSAVPADWDSSQLVLVRKFI